MGGGLEVFDWFGLLIGVVSEEMSWLFSFDLSANEVTTGLGWRRPDGTYAFREGASAGGETYQPQTATLDAMDPPWTATWSEPVLLSGWDDGPVTDYPLRELRVHASPLTPARDCIGRWAGEDAGWEHGGRVHAFVTVEDAMHAPYGDETLCDNLSGAPDGCVESPRSEWSRPPDSMCDASGCQSVADGADCEPGSTCNAWELSASFSAVAVDIQP